MRRWASWVESRCRVDADYWRRAAQFGSWRGLWSPFRINFTPSKEGDTMTGQDDYEYTFIDADEKEEGR